MRVTKLDEGQADELQLASIVAVRPERLLNDRGGGADAIGIIARRVSRWVGSPIELSSDDGGELVRPALSSFPFLLESSALGYREQRQKQNRGSTLVKIEASSPFTHLRA